MNFIRRFKKYFNSSSWEYGAQTKSSAPKPELKAPSTQTASADMPESDLLTDGDVTSPEKSSSTTEPVHSEGRAQHATTKDESSDSPKSPSKKGDRPKLQPKHPKDIHRKPTKPYMRPHPASQVVFEVFKDPNDPKPKGYMGTVGGARICRSTVEDYCPCGTGGGHYLLCGHTVVGDAACGANCKSGPHDQQPFNCPKCREIVHTIFENKLTKEERANVEHHYKKKDVLAIPLCVEYITKYIPTAHGNIAETVVGMLTSQYGRECQAVPDDTSKPQTLAEMFEEHHNALEQKTRAKLAENKLGPLNTPKKRKDKDGQATNSEETASSMHDLNKKQKLKFETHREPVTDQNRGIKRAAMEEDLSDAETLVDIDETSSTTKISNKKQKQKFETHRQPVTWRTHGTKRKLAKCGSFAYYINPSKRIMTSFDKVSEEALFLPIPSYVAGTLGQLVRKRGQSQQLEFTEGNKRMRN
jgi:hypothetical protein